MTIQFEDWEDNCERVADSLKWYTDAEIQSPPEGQRFTAEAQAKIDSMRALAQQAVDDAAIVVPVVYEDIPPVPEGETDIFATYAYELDYSVQVGSGLTELSGLTIGPGGTSLWLVTDSVQNGGRLHELDFNGNVLRSINLVGRSIDSEDITYMYDPSPGVGRWALCSEGGDEGIHVFDMPHNQTNTLDIGLYGWFHPEPAAGEALAYNNGKLHLCGGGGYKLVSFDGSNFISEEGVFQTSSLPGSLRVSIRAAAFAPFSPSLFRVQSYTGNTDIQEIDITTPGLSDADRFFSEYNIHDQSNPDIKWKVEGMAWRSIDEFYLVSEPVYNQIGHNFRRYKRIV